jgi:Tfp pilus assembly protein PilV
MDKSSGIGFDRQAFATSTEQAPRSASPLVGTALLVIAVVVLGFVGYKILTHAFGDAPAADGRVLLQVQQQLTEIQGRLEKLEQTRARAAAAPSSSVKLDPSASADGNAHKTPRTAYQVTPTYAQPKHVVVPDTATSQKLDGIQKGLGTLQNDTSANREAWQATTDRLADVAGEVGTQRVEILRNRDEVDQLLARTERTAIPFELLRGSNPQSFGSVSLGLKAANQKNHHYTMCVYVQGSCIELRDRSLYEVVEFSLSRGSQPLMVVATKVAKDRVLGFLELPSGTTKP